MNEIIFLLQEYLDRLEIKIILNNAHLYILLILLCFFILFTYFIVKKSLSSKAKGRENLIKDEEKTPLYTGPVKEKKGAHKLFSIFTQGFFATKIDKDVLEQLEEAFYRADITPTLVEELLEKLENKMKEGPLEERGLKDLVKSFLKEKMNAVQEGVDRDFFDFKGGFKGPRVIMIVGVNGAGKTTTIGKLISQLSSKGAKVVVGACDTFRAAAVEQLEIWCNRSKAQLVKGKGGSSPSGVSYEALRVSISSKADYCILDTAGRLHVMENLMEELNKSKRVLSKLDIRAPHQILLVLDSITGNNAMVQAREFHRVLDLTGIILTKCDASSKAGSAISIVENLKIPIVYMGTGESIEDLNIFNLDEYLNAILEN